MNRPRILRTPPAAALALTLGAIVGCSEPTKPSRSPKPQNAQATDHPNIDATTGLIKAPGWQHVASNCNACHSTRHFLAMRGDRQTWDASITWMQQSQGLWPLTPGVRTKIVNYLATHYGPGSSGTEPQPRAGGMTLRRPPLATHLLPPNPYASGR